MISLKWKYKRDVVIVSTYLEVEEDVKVCRRKQLFRSLLKKSIRVGSEELKNATRRRQKNLRK
jgi:TfoX/Sxy family transcriptional regulator of competence genes